MTSNPADPTGTGTTNWSLAAGRGRGKIGEYREFDAGLYHRHVRARLADKIETRVLT